jgi:hypothetical protein
MGVGVSRIGSNLRIKREGRVVQMAEGVVPIHHVLPLYRAVLRTAELRQIRKPQVSYLCSLQNTGL